MLRSRSPPPGWPGCWSRWPAPSLRGRRWPTGVFVTAQLLVALVALSLGGRALLTAADNPGIAVATAAALVLSAGGLVGVRLLTAAAPAGPRSDAA